MLIYTHKQFFDLQLMQDKNENCIMFFILNGLVLKHYKLVCILQFSVKIQFLENTYHKKS